MVIRQLISINTLHLIYLHALPSDNVKAMHKTTGTLINASVMYKSKFHQCLDKHLNYTRYVDKTECG